MTRIKKVLNDVILDTGDKQQKDKLSAMEKFTYAPVEGKDARTQTTEGNWYL